MECWLFKIQFDRSKCRQDNLQEKNKQKIQGNSSTTETNSRVKGGFFFLQRNSIAQFKTVEFTSLQLQLSNDAAEDAM
jgi:hypothetical protein